MIKNFRHKGLENLFFCNKTMSEKADHVKKLRQILAILNAAITLDEIKSIKPLRCHTLTGARKKCMLYGKIKIGE